MTSTISRGPLGSFAPPERSSRTGGSAPRPPVRWVDAPPTSQATSILLAMISGVLLFLLVNLVFVSQVQHYTSQKSLYSQLRLSLAQGSAPVSPTDKDGKLLPDGTPLVIMRAPDIGLLQEVVVEGRSSAETMLGIGHRRVPDRTVRSALRGRSSSPVTSSP
jgi:sortase A